MKKHAIIVPVMLMAAGNMTQAFAATNTVAKSMTYRSPEGMEYMKISVTAKDGIITVASATPLATDSTSLYLQKGFAEKFSSAVVGKAVKGLRVDTISGASLTTSAFNTFIANNTSALLKTAAPVVTNPIKSTPVVVTNPTVNSTLTLQAKIEGNYKVVGTFTPVTGKKVKLYKVIVSYEDGTKDYVFTIGANMSSFMDWHAKQNMVNTYTISAVLEDGSIISANSVKVVMGANGEATTEDALGSTQTNNIAPKNKEDHDYREKSEKMEKMKRDDDDDEKEDMHTNTGNLRRENRGLIQSVKKSLLSEKTKNSLNTKLENIPVADRSVIYGKILTKIDALIAKYQASGATDRTINLLLEVKSIIQDKLASLSDDAIIEEVLAQ